MWRLLLLIVLLPPQARPEILLVLHNAHYNGTFPVPNKLRRTWVYG